MEKTNPPAGEGQEDIEFLASKAAAFEKGIFQGYHPFYETDSKAATALAILKSGETRQVRRIRASVGMFAIIAFWGIPLWTGYHWWEYLWGLLP